MKRSIASIVASVSWMAGVKESDITGPSRLADIVRARMAVYRLARDAGHSTKAIGRRLHRDHSTVIYGSRQALVRDDVAALLRLVAA